MSALAPDQLYRLVETICVLKMDSLWLLSGVKLDGRYVANLKNPGSGYEHPFAATNTAGMGVAGSARSTALPGHSNGLKDSLTSPSK